MVEFWTSMEHLHEARLRCVETAETYLVTQGVAVLIDKGLAILKDEVDFWKAFSYLCSKYSSTLDASPELFSLPSSGLSSAVFVGGGGGGGGPAEGF
jgi:hypothetical protein